MIMVVIMLSLWSEHSCLTRQEIRDYIKSIQSQDVTTEGEQVATTVVTTMEEFGPTLDIGNAGDVVKQSIGEQDSTTEMMRNVTTEGGQSATTVVTAMKEFGPTLDIGNALVFVNTRRVGAQVEQTLRSLGHRPLLLDGSVPR